MYLEVASLRDVRVRVDDTVILEFQLSDAPDPMMKEIIEDWPRPSHHELTVDGSVLRITCTGGPQNAIASAQWLIFGRGPEGPPLPQMRARYDQMLDMREALFAHLDEMMRNRPV